MGHVVSAAWYKKDKVRTSDAKSDSGKAGSFPTVYTKNPKKLWGWVNSICAYAADFLWASCWNKPVGLNGIHLRRMQCILIPPSACTLCSDDKFQSVAWGIYFHSTSLFPRLRSKASSPSLPVTLEVLHLLYIWWNSMRQWKFTRCCRKKQGKVKAQPRNKKWVLFACTFIDFWQPCYFQGQQKGKEFQSLNGWVIYYPLLFN